MKKYLLGLFSLWMASSVSANAQTVYAFEGESIAEDGWTTYSSCEQSGWSLINYATDYTFNVPSVGGSKAVRSTSGALNVIGKVNPSSWLISPKVSVPQGGTLNFLMAYNASYNANNQVTTDDERVKFEILVSETTADTTSFTQVVYALVPKGLSQFAQYSVDLSKYAGKDVYLAFHEYGTPRATPFIKNFLYLDNIKVSTSPVADLGVVSTPVFKNGCLTTQPVEVAVTNYGAATSSVTFNYQVGDGAVVTEVYDTPIASGDTITYTFAKMAEFAVGAKQNVKVWCETAGDDFTDNNEAKSEVNIYPVKNIPYTLNTADAIDEFNSTYSKRSGTSYQGWYYTANVGAWIYTKITSTNRSYLYSTSSFALKAGKVRMKLRTTATATPASMKVYLTQVEGEFGAPVDSIALKTTLDATDHIVLVDVPADGNYIVALEPEVDGQCGFFGFALTEPIEDILPTSIVSPATSLLTSAAVPVTARFRNDGIMDQSNVKVGYQYGDNVAVEETIASIKVGEEVEYTFAQLLDLSAEATNTLKVWSHFEADGDAANDTISQDVTTYGICSLPFATSFESDKDAMMWKFVNTDNDDVYWAIEPMTLAIDGSNALYINTMSNLKTKDYAISPAIAFTADDVNRLSFYYGKVSAIATRVSKLDVYLSQSADVANLASATLIASYSHTDNSYHYSSTQFSAPATGNYYLIFASEGGSGDLIVDDIRIDKSEELLMIDASCSSVGDDYEHPDATITATYVNVGATAQSGITFKYDVVAKDINNKVLSTKTFTELFEGSIAPGDTAVYEFNQKVSFSTAAFYTIVTYLESANDTDTKNNQFTAEGPVLLQTHKAPTTLGFEKPFVRRAVKTQGKWSVNTTTPYIGSYGINHQGAPTFEGGDWIFVNRMNIPKGTYDFSFYWKTMTGNVAANAAQSFAVYIGKEATPEAMTTKLIEFTDTINADHKCHKELLPLEIEEDGNYFIGILCNSASNALGNLTIDEIGVLKPKAGTKVLNGTPYVADFAKKEGQWYHYHPTSTSSQWTKLTANGATSMTTKRTYSTLTNLWTTPGFYEAPAFYFEKGVSYEVEYDYAIAASGSDALDGNSYLDLFMAHRDTPSSFTTLVARGGESYITEGLDKGTAVANIEVPETGVYYLAFMPDSKVSAQFTLQSFSLTYLKETSVDGVFNKNNAIGIKVCGDVVSISGGYQRGEIWSVNGSLCATLNGETEVNVGELPAGVYVAKLQGEGAPVAIKFILK